MKRLKNLLVPVALPPRASTAMLLLRLVAGAAFGIACTMVVAVHRHAIIDGGPFVGKGSYELALLFLVIAIVLTAVGPGRYSVDAKLKARL